MNDLRKAAQMALKFCEALEENYWGDRKAVINSLRAALAQSEQTRSQQMRDAGYTRRPRQLPEEEDEQEPVAWMVYTLDGKSVCVTDNPADFTDQHKALPLYTAPPQRKPLTEEQIDVIVSKNVTITDQNLSGAVYMSMRDLEAAHEIF